MAKSKATGTFRRSFCAVLWLALAGIVPFARQASASSSVVAANLSCDRRQEPLGVDQAAPRFGWILRETRAGLRGVGETAYEVVVARPPAPAEQPIPKQDGERSGVLPFGRERVVWDSGKIDTGGLSSADRLGVAYAGKPLASHAAYLWRVRVWDEHGQPSPWSRPAGFSTGMLQPGDWQAKWIGGLPNEAPGKASSLPVFRHEFVVAKPVSRAVLFVSALGQGEVRLNGRPVTDAVMQPGWTNYRKRVPYNTVDVTRRLRPGANALGVLLGNGMYNVPHTEDRYEKFDGGFGPPKLLLQLEIAYRDGTVSTIASGADWQTAEGPIRFSSIYGGEDYDARLVSPGWDRAGFPASGWHPARVIDGPGGALHAEAIPPIRIERVYRPIAQRRFGDRVTVYDLGQNFSGFPELTVSGRAGGKVRITPGELLDTAGHVTQKSSGGPMWFEYTLAGRQTETWRPRFSYTGFRYLEVETIPAAGEGNAPTGLPKVLAAQGDFIHASVAPVGAFQSSIPLFARIHRLIEAAVLSNTQSIMTDCPTREKLGWLEQTYLMGAGLFYNHDMAQIYAKMLDDMADSQLSEGPLAGLVPSIAPEYPVFDGGFRDSPEWGSASVLSVWTAYQFTGDRALLQRAYPTMRRYVDYLTAKSKAEAGPNPKPDGLLDYGLGDWYDIGPNPPGYAQLTSATLTATATYYRDLTVLGRIDALLGKSDAAEADRRRAAQVKASFDRALYHSDPGTHSAPDSPGSGYFDRDSQTANAMALDLGLVPAGAQSGVMAHLLADIRAHHNHLTAGDIGFHYVLRALGETSESPGSTQVALDMLTRNDPPSYGYQLSQGATALTEAWNANRDDSQDHFMLGHAEEWFYRYFAGLDFDMSRDEGEQITLRPPMPTDSAGQPAPRTPATAQPLSASASCDSVLGRIAIAWRNSPAGYELAATIPAGSAATVFIPASSPEQVMESGKPASGPPGVRFLRMEKGYAVYQVSSGSYRFRVR